MTLNEYAIKLGLSLNSTQIQILNLIEEKQDESLIISFPRVNGRQLLYNLVERKKGFDDGYQQGRADVVDEILSLKKLNHYDMYNELMYQSVKVEDIEQLKEQTND